LLRLEFRFFITIVVFTFLPLFLEVLDLLLMEERVSYKSDNGTLSFNKTSATLRDAVPSRE